MLLRLKLVPQGQQPLLQSYQPAAADMDFSDLHAQLCQAASAPAVSEPNPMVSSAESLDLSAPLGNVASEPKVG